MDWLAKANCCEALLRSINRVLSPWPATVDMKVARWNSSVCCSTPSVDVETQKNGTCDVISAQLVFFGLIAHILANKCQGIWVHIFTWKKVNPNFGKSKVPFARKDWSWNTSCNTNMSPPKTGFKSSFPKVRYVSFLESLFFLTVISFTHSVPHKSYWSQLQFQAGPLLPGW